MIRTSLFFSRSVLLQPNNKVFVYLLTACAKLGDEQMASQLFSEMKSYGLKPDVYVYSALLSVYANTQNINRAFIILDQMVPLSILTKANGFL